MSRNGSGTYTLNSAGQPVVAGTTITATAFNAATADLATALTQSICVDGQTPTTGVIPFASGISLAGGNTLAVYITGSWTPTDASGAGLSFVTANGFYTQIGNVVTIFGLVQYPVTANGSAAAITLPKVAANSGTNGQASINVIAQSSSVATVGFPNKNAATMGFLQPASVTVTNAAIANGTVYFGGSYLST